jgi:hypothetical protein
MSPAQDGVVKWYRGIDLHYNKGLYFARRYHCISRQFGKIPLYFDMPSSYTMNDVGIKSVMRTSHSEKMQVTVTY